MNGWPVSLGVYVISMWVVGVLVVRHQNTQITYTDSRSYQEDGLVVLFAPVLLPLAILFYIIGKMLKFIGRLASGIPFKGR